MTLADLLDKWTARHGAWRALGIRVDGEKLAVEVLADLRALGEQDTVTLREAEQIGGYSADHLSRLLRTGVIENVGRKHAPRLRRSDVPSKPGRCGPGLPVRATGTHFLSRRRIVADAQPQRDT